MTKGMAEQLAAAHEKLAAARRHAHAQSITRSLNVVMVGSYPVSAPNQLPPFADAWEAVRTAEQELALLLARPSGEG